MGRKRNKDQIVYNSGLNFHTVVPYLKIIIRNGLAVRWKGAVPRYKTMPKGAEAFQGAGGADS